MLDLLCLKKLKNCIVEKRGEPLILFQSQHGGSSKNINHETCANPDAKICTIYLILEKGSKATSRPDSHVRPT